MHSTPIKCLFQVSFPLGKPGGARGDPAGPPGLKTRQGGGVHLRERGEGGSAHTGRASAQQAVGGGGGGRGESLPLALE